MQRSMRTAIATAAGGAAAVALLLHWAFSRPASRIDRPAGQAPDAVAELRARNTQVASGAEPADAAPGRLADRSDDALHSARESGAGDPRLDAIAALGDVSRADATVVLVSLLDDAHLAVREQAVESLGAIGGDEAVAGLAYALSDDSASVRHLAIDVLSEIGSETAIGALALTLDDTDVGIREHAIEALADLGGEAAASVMQRFEADPEARIRELAAGTAENDG